jgi:glycosyltransferase involved in cell wall biosynthesis
LADTIAPVTNREGLEEYALRWVWGPGGQRPGFTAVVRARDEARSLPFVLPPLLRSVERVVLVDNGSADGTPEVAEQVAKGAGLAEKLDVYAYPFDVSRCGPEHLGTHPESVHSLAYFYNWSFSHVRTRYALKWDADMVPTPRGERALRDLAWQLEGVEGAITLRRDPVYVESERVAYVDTIPGKPEPWGWRNSPEHTFGKAFDWELMLPQPGDHVLRLPDSVCFELKWLDADEFAHWSHSEFKDQINARKRRDWEVFHALREGAPLPANLVRVESPGGKHIVEHLRETYAMHRRGTGPSAAGGR